VREQVLRVAERVPVDAAEPRLLATIALVAPFARGSAVVERVPRAARAAAGDPHSGHLVGMAAHAVGDFDAALRVFGATAEGLREQGRLGLLAHVLGMRSWAAFLLGDWWLAGAASAEGVRLAGETDQPIWRAGATMALAALAGARGDDERAQALVAEAERIVLPRRISALLALVQTVRGITALTAGRPDDAHAQLARAFDPADPAYHPREQYGAVGLLADAAALSGRPGPARAIVEELGRRAAPSSAPGLVLSLDYARAVLAEDADAEPRFTAALEAVGLPRAFDRARLELAFGMWLRRHGRVVESREQLRPALDGFDRLDARPWADRARRELRAAGERRGARRREAWDDLSPQEQQIARMAAGGLSNREIGQRLYLSHRTVANHLYRTFPKLGVTSRAQLGRTLPEAGA
jgi:ATP/maltotriose-dependent transcriptional regulator MalT